VRLVRRGGEMFRLLRTGRWGVVSILDAVELDADVRGLFRRYPTVGGDAGRLCGFCLRGRLLCGVFGGGIAFDFVGCV